MQTPNKDYRNIHLAILAIEGGAHEMKTSGRDMYDRLNAQGLISDYLIRYYDLLHTQSREWLIESTIEALHNWEEASR